MAGEYKAMSYRIGMTMLTYNRLEDTKITLPNVIKTASNKVAWALTVIDNGSSDGTQEYLKEQFELKMIDTLVLLKENIGVAKGQNVGWCLHDKNGAEIVGKIDNDVFFHKNNWLDAILNVLDNSPEIGALGYNCEHKNTYHIVNNGKVLYRFKGGNIGGACFFVPKHVHETLGYWTEDFDKYGEEDADYGVRIILAGFKNAYMDDETVMEHFGHDSKEYREFKDIQRQDNLKGSFQQVYNSYHNKSRSLKFETNILNEITEKDLILFEGSHI